MEHLLNFNTRNFMRLKKLEQKLGYILVIDK